MTAVAMAAEVDEPAFTVAEFGFTATEKSLVTVEPLVNGAKMWVKSQVFWLMPEQESSPPLPAQLPLSRWSAQKDSVLMPFETAQLYTVVALATVKVSAAPKSSMPTISVMPIEPHSCAGVFDG